MNSIYELNKLMRAMQVVVKPVWFDKDIFQLRGALDMISYPPAGLFSLEILWELKKEYFEIYGQKLLHNEPPIPHLSFYINLNWP